MTRSKQNVAANLLDVGSILASTSVLAAITQHAHHLNQLNQHFIAMYVSHSETSFIVNPDFQLVPLVPIAVLLVIAAAFLRRKVSILLLISLIILVCASVMWLFGFRLAHI